MKATGTHLFATMLACITTTLTVHATTFYVSPSGSHTAPYTNWVTAATNIQTAVAAAASDDTVLVTNGTYTVGINISNIRLESVNGPAVTMAQKTAYGRCFWLHGSAVLSGFTVTGGDATGTTGGGINCDDGNQVVTNCIITGNTADNGGGMYRGTAYNCTISSNTANYGAGLHSSTVYDCIISSNTAFHAAGGMYGGTANHCTTRGNVAQVNGGGMVVGTANNCAIIGNSAQTGRGGGMYQGTANNCTISGNTALDLAGGMYYGTAVNCIIWYNSAQNGPDLYSVTSMYVCSPDVTAGGGNITSAPAFVDANNGNYQLRWTSPCRDAGNNAYTNSLVDLAGSDRVIGGTVDLGAYEVMDNDGDQLSDSDEMAHGSDPQVADLFRYVSSEGSHVYPYLTWDSAATNIQAAVDAAGDGIAVFVTNGVYMLSSEITVTKSLTIQGVGGGESTIVDGGGTTRCFNLGASDCMISGFTITNGMGLMGGGVYCSSTTPSVSNCVISGNVADSGGGMAGGTATDCTISGNSAGFDGGGMYDGTANSCFIIDNVADRSGGGMFSGTANGCLISRNSTDFGGGLYLSTANNCLISGNSASSQGGGMFVCTANNCIVWYNIAAMDADLYSGISKFVCSPDVTPGVNGNITSAPAFIDQAGGNYRLAFGSPCINAGSNVYVVGSTDLDGKARIVDATVDMGAYEYDESIYDSDSDGLVDGDEVIAGTDPTNGASYFAITNAGPVAEGFVIQWVSASNRVYTVRRSGSLTNSAQIIASGINGPLSSYTDMVYAVENTGFYDVQVEFP